MSSAAKHGPSIHATRDLKSGVVGLFFVGLVCKQYHSIQREYCRLLVRVEE